MESKEEYNSCLDFIKGIACICVVFLHCEFPGILGDAVKAISRYCVPFFFMVSGYYYLSDKTLEVNERKRKAWHICKITVWATLFYLVFEIIQTLLSQSPFEPYSWKDFLIFLGCNKPCFITGEMWFLYALLYVYLALVFVKQEWYRNNSGKMALVCNPSRHKGLIQRLGRDCSLMVYIIHPAVWHSMDGVYKLIGIWDNLPVQYLKPILVAGISILLAITFNVIVRSCNQRIATKIVTG